MASRIEDYALIGDCETAALVGRDGSLDWLCLPRFDSGACFAALLGRPEYGRWLLAPAGRGQPRVRRRYRGDTLILETTFETADGAVTLIDCMPVREAAPSLIRCVRGERGKVKVNMELVIRFDYGSIMPWVRKIEGGIKAVAGPDTLVLRTPVELSGVDWTTRAEFTVSEGEQVPLVLTWYPSHEEGPPPLDASGAIEQTERTWQEWASRCTYDGPWRDQVMRSLLTLKALTYAPTGGILAAATTSLPEKIGGVRNWDYRYCWLRDATFTLCALLSAGYAEEARRWRDWLLRAVAGEPSKLQIMYGLAGERRLPEWQVSWLPGYEGSSPVRVGNAAHQQLQLDVWGEVLDALYQARRALGEDSYDWGLETALADHLEQAWKLPDEGIWEMRGGKRHLTHSKVMAWVGVDRAIKSGEQMGLDGPVKRWKRLRRQLHDEICARGYSTDLGSFVQSYGSEAMDASLLMIPLVGFLPPEDPRVQGTVAAVERQLLHDGFVRRYNTSSVKDGLPPGEGAFLPCTFWLVDNWLLQGRRKEAEELFQRLVGLCNDIGLLSEEYDPHSDRLLGNFPQAFTHVGLVNSAFNLAGKESHATRRQKG
jgi:GH15 family glucan-1,4-alpha-glucosidase